MGPDGLADGTRVPGRWPSMAPSDGTGHDLPHGTGPRASIMDPAPRRCSGAIGRPSIIEMRPMGPSAGHRSSHRRWPGPIGPSSIITSEMARAHRIRARRPSGLEAGAHRPVIDHHIRDGMTASASTGPAPSARHRSAASGPDAQIGIRVRDRDPDPNSRWRSEIGCQHRRPSRSSSPELVSAAAHRAQNRLLEPTPGPRTKGSNRPQIQVRLLEADGRSAIGPAAAGQDPIAPRPHPSNASGPSSTMDTIR